MDVMGRITEYIENADRCMPILSDDIYKYVNDNIPGVKKNIINEYITRYSAKNPDFIRYQKGIYYKTVVTPFGKAGINYSALVRRTYITDGTDVYGYETGPSLMNRIGLTTQLPTHTYLATEHLRRSVGVTKDNLILTKPITSINRDNYRYLQLLDMLDNKLNVKFEADNHLEILRSFINKYKLDFELLLCYARFYKNKDIFARIAELARGKNEI